MKSLIEAELPTFDLVAWDFGDTLCDQMFMRIAPDGVPEWTSAYDRVLDVRPDWVDDWMLGRVPINDLVQPLALELGMPAADVARHLGGVWRENDYFPEVMEWLHRLAGTVRQAIVTVNPWEFSGIATAGDLDLAVDVVVTSAELASLSKVVMAERARELLGLAPGLSTTLLIDNSAPNVEEFVHAGGRGLVFEREMFARIAPDVFAATRSGR